VVGRKLVDGANPATISRLHMAGDWKLLESWASGRERASHLEPGPASTQLLVRIYPGIGTTLLFVQLSRVEGTPALARVRGRWQVSDGGMLLMGSRGWLVVEESGPGSDGRAQPNKESGLFTCSATVAPSKWMSPRLKVPALSPVLFHKKNLMYHVQNQKKS